MLIKIYKYQKVTDKFTTYLLVEPDYQEGDNRITELCNIDNNTYVSVPDDVILPSQPEIISKTLSEVILTDELRYQIKKESVHVQLINQRVVEKIRDKYSENDEFSVSRNKVASEPESEINFNEYNTYVKSCISWGINEKAKLGL